MNIKLLTFVLTVFLFIPCDILLSKSTYPEKEWKKKDPGKMGLNKKALLKIDSLMRKANGVLINKSYLVSEWNYGGSVNKRFEA